MQTDTTSAWVVDSHGIGSVRVGMSLAQLKGVVGELVRPFAAIDPECDHVRAHALPAGVLLMILKDTVARVEVDTAGILTREGAGVGQLESQVLALYGSRARVEPHHYTGPTGHYLVVEQPGDTLHRIVFETDGQRVERYRAGKRPGVEYVEGCA